MWALVAGYLLFYVLTIVHLRALKRRVVCALRFDIHRLQSEIARSMAREGSPMEQGSEITRIVGAILDRVESDTPAALFIHAVWVTPLVVFSEIFGWESFDRAFSSTVRESVISVLQSTVTYYIQTRDKNLR